MADQSKIDALRMRARVIKQLAADLSAVTTRAETGLGTGGTFDKTAITAANAAIITETSAVTALLASL